jgi:hypothetical protein
VTVPAVVGVEVSNAVSAIVTRIRIPDPARAVKVVNQRAKPAPKRYAKKVRDEENAAEAAVEAVVVEAVETGRVVSARAASARVVSARVVNVRVVNVRVANVVLAAGESVIATQAGVAKAGAVGPRSSPRSR